MSRPPAGPSFNGKLPDNLEPLKSHRRWLVWRWELHDGKWAKVPYQPKHSGRSAKVTEPDHWTFYDEALAVFHRGGFSGVGFVLNGKEISAFDLDKCVSRGVDGEIILTPLARKLVERCGSYCELTPSGNGLRIIGLSRDGGAVQTKFKVVESEADDWILEVYRNTPRYITVTGVPLDGYDLFPVNIDERIDEALLMAPSTPKIDPALWQSTFVEGDFSDCADLEEAVDPDVLEDIRDGASRGDRSEKFHRVICKLFTAGFKPEQIVGLLKRYPRGIAAKYGRRLEGEVKRSWDKADQAQALEADAQNVETIPARGDGNVVVVAVSQVEAQAIAEATGYEVRHALDGGVIRPEPDRRFIYALVNGRNGNPTQARTRRENILQWEREGLVALQATPFNRDRRDAGWVDLLREQGPEALKARLDLWAVEQEHVADPALTLDEARQEQAARMDAFREAALNWNPLEPAPRHICGMDVGGGKSFAAQDCAIDIKLALRDQGRKETVTDSKPTHKLIGEQLEEYQKKAAKYGLKVAVYKGPSAKIDPSDPSDDAPRMCARHKEVEEAEKLAVYRDELCAKCPHNPKNGGACAYLSQHPGDINLVPHAVAFQPRLPEMLSKDGVAATILDEGFYDAAMAEPVEIRLDEIEGMRLPQEIDDRLELLDKRHRLVTNLRDAPLGFLRGEHLFKPGSEVTLEQAYEALELEKKRRMTEADEPNWRKRTPNKSLRKAILLWSAIADIVAHAMIGLGDCRSLWVAEILENEDGERLVRISGRRHLADKISNVPTLVIDANHTPNLVREVLPRAEDKGTISIAAPYRTVRQYTNRTYSLGYLVPYREPKDGRSRSKEAEEREVARAKLAKVHRRDTVAVILRRHRELGGECLIVGNKDVVTSPEFQNLPDGVSVAWFGAVAGLNKYDKARLVVTIGRWPVTPSAVETNAAALTGRPVERLKDEDGNSAWYPTAMGYRLKRDGDRTLRIPAEHNAHPDPVAEALRARVFVGEIVQSTGRTRAVRRTANDPVEEMVLGNEILPYAVDEFISDAEMQATPTDLMLADGYIAFEGAAAAYAFYGADRRDGRQPLWLTYEAAKKNLQRERSGTNPYREPLIGKCPRAFFQQSGNGQRPQHAIVDLRICPDPRAVIEAVLGPLAKFEILTPDVQPVVVEPVIELTVPAPEPARGGRVFKVTIEEGIYAQSMVSFDADVGDPIPTAVWECLRLLASACGMTHADVAQQLGMSPSHLASIESASRKPPRWLQPAIEDLIRSLSKQGRPLVDLEVTAWAS